MISWIMCSVFGLITVLFTPGLLAGTVKILSNVGRKYPRMADVVATLTIFIVGLVMVGMVGVFSAVYHHLWVGKP